MFLKITSTQFVDHAAGAYLKHSYGLVFSVPGTGNYSAHYQTGKVNTNPTINPYVYSCGLFAWYGSAIVAQSFGIN